MNVLGTCQLRPTSQLKLAGCPEPEHHTATHQKVKINVGLESLSFRGIIMEPDRTTASHASMRLHLCLKLPAASERALLPEKDLNRKAHSLIAKNDYIAGSRKMDLLF